MLQFELLLVINIQQKYLYVGTQQNAIQLIS